MLGIFSETLKCETCGERNELKVNFGGGSWKALVLFGSILMNLATSVTDNL